ncbi:MAG: adenylosuccinate lyase [Deltaproteobacteria bacterium]|nr:adenylosuccinate lyase [Deltaproteobacteria bacterium]
MIPRYSRPALQRIWSAEHRYASWLRVELAACEAMEEAGIVPAGTAASIAPRVKLRPGRIEEIEETTRHDVIAFLTHVEEQAGPPARWLHRGMTSSDVLDTAFALQLTEAVDEILRGIDALCSALRERAIEHRGTAIIGRTHGIHAEPTSLGLVFAGLYAALGRDRARLALARTGIAYGKISGAVGTFAHLDPAIERGALRRLGLEPEPVATQVVPRDRHAQLLCVLALTAASIERFALTVRHWQRTEVLEAEEPFEKGQKGSSAMPHKRNPILSENLCGLARIVRAAVAPALEDVALWHERDISHSSVERMIAPDATATLDFMLARACKLAQGLVVYPENIQRNLELTGGLVFSEGVLLALVDAGIGRQEAYVMVQRNAMRAWAGEGGFQELLEKDQEVIGALGAEKLRRCFDLGLALRHVDAILERVLSPEEA